jgi:putative NADPH-quinone reductase
MQVLTVLCHPRAASLTAALAGRFRAGLAAAGHGGELADLYAEGFDPLLFPPDEPDWDDASKRYSAAVLAEQARIERHQAIALIFPVWWWSMPAMLKGWIDRVWNRGWAYDESKLALKRGLMLGVAAGSARSYEGKGYRAAIEAQLVEGIYRFCNVTDARLELFHDVLDDVAIRGAALERAETLGRDFARGLD